jgi:protein-S-isoprenylcysteine O-methyltransferase Ste14
MATEFRSAIFDEPTAAEASDRRPPFKVAPTFVIDLAVSLAYVAAIVPHWIGSALIRRPFWPQIALTALILVCYFGKVLVITHLDKGGGDARTYVKSSDLVTSGPYAFSRHPTYTVAMAQFLLWSALALYLQAYEPFQPALVAAAFGLPLIFFLINDWVVMPSEEAMLRRLHPDAYEAYARRVRRWIGRKAAA